MLHGQRVIELHSRCCTGYRRDRQRHANSRFRCRKTNVPIQSGYARNAGGWCPGGEGGNARPSNDIFLPSSLRNASFDGRAIHLGSTSAIVEGATNIRASLAATARATVAYRVRSRTAVHAVRHAWNGLQRQAELRRFVTAPRIGLRPRMRGDFPSMRRLCQDEPSRALCDRRGPPPDHHDEVPPSGRVDRLLLGSRLPGPTPSCSIRISSSLKIGRAHV